MHVIGAPLWSFNNLTVSPVEGLLIASKPSSDPLIITLPVKKATYFVPSSSILIENRFTSLKERPSGSTGKRSQSVSDIFR